MKKVAITILWGMILAFCCYNAVEAYMHRPKKIQGDYYMCADDIDGVYMYGVFNKREAPLLGYESVKLIGTDGDCIYWSTFGTTNYRIDTTENKQIQIDTIPNGVKMMPAVEFYKTLD